MAKKVKKIAFGAPLTRPIDFYKEYIPARRSHEPVAFLKKLGVIDERKLKKWYELLVFLFCIESLLFLL